MRPATQHSTNAIADAPPTMIFARPKGDPTTARRCESLGPDGAVDAGRKSRSCCAQV
jgi:hypothetical protein